MGKLSGDAGQAHGDSLENTGLPVSGDLSPPLGVRWTIRGGTPDYCLGAAGAAFVVVVAPKEQLVAVDRRGCVMWTVDGQYASPNLLPGNRLLVTKGHQGLACLDAGSGVEIWRAETSASLRLVVEDRLVVATEPQGSSSDVAVCELPPSRECIWRYAIRPSDRASSLDSAMASDGMRLFCLERDEAAGRFAVVALSMRDGAELWRTAVTDRWGAPDNDKWRPQVVDGRLVFRTASEVVCIETSSGSVGWTRHGGRAHTVDRDKVYLTGDSDLIVLGLRDGAVLLERDLRRDLEPASNPSELMGVPAVSDSHLFSVGRSGRLWAFAKESGTPEWWTIPPDSTGFLGVTRPVVAGGCLYVASFSMDPKRLQYLYCFQSSEGSERDKGTSPAVSAKSQDGGWGELGFEVLEVLGRRTLTERAPYHRPGRAWTFYRCRMSTGEAEFLFGEKAGRKTALGTVGQSVLVAASARDADALLGTFRRALGRRKPAGERPARRIKAPTLVGSFSLATEDVPELRKLTSLDGSAELLIAWDPEKRRGAFLEKDEVYRDAVVQLIADLAVR